MSNLLGFDESKFKVTTGVAGGIGTLLAAFGLLNAFQSFLSLMSALIPPLAGVLIASYWIVGKGKKENFAIRSGFSAVGVISFAVGAIFACITGGTFASFPSLVEALPFLNWPFLSARSTVSSSRSCCTSSLRRSFPKRKLRNPLSCRRSERPLASPCVVILMKEGKGHAKNRYP